MKTRKFVLISGITMVFVMALAGYETALGSPVTAGSNPISVAADPTGKYVYVANAGSNNVSMYSVGTDGALTDVNAQAAAGQYTTTSPSAAAMDYLNAGFAAADRRDHEEAIRLYTKAIASGDLSPNNLFRAHLARGHSWLLKPDYGKAIADYTKAIELNQKHTEPYIFRGSAWENKGDYDKAIADYTKLIKINPNDASAYEKRGKAWGKKRDYDEAIADFTKAIEIDPKSAFFYLSRGDAWKDKHADDKAIVDYTKAIDLMPNWELPYFLRGQAWARKGDDDKAIADVNKAIEINPNHFFAKQLRDSLRKEKGDLTASPQKKVAHASAVPEGFAGIPWGAGTDQITKTMSEQGYRQLKGTGPGQLVFRGAFAGFPCQLSFNLIANAFFSAGASYCARSPYSAGPQATFNQIVDMLSEKYGPPRSRESGKSRGNDGVERPQAYAIWDLVDNRSSDKYRIFVQFYVTWFTDTKGDQYVVDVNYYADNLEKRLKKKEY